MRAGWSAPQTNFTPFNDTVNELHPQKILVVSVRSVAQSPLGCDFQKPRTLQLKLENIWHLDKFLSATARDLWIREVDTRAQQDTQCTYNVTLRCVRVTIVAVEKQ
jgi:hypothetical protein